MTGPRTISQGLCWLVAGLALAAAPSGAEGIFVDLRFENAGGGEVAVEPASGWPLTLVLDVREDRLLGFGYDELSSGLYPYGGRRGYLVFEDPDGCPSWIASHWQEWVADGTQSGDDPPYPGSACPVPRPLPPWPRDETWVEVVPGIAVPDPADCGRRPEVLTFEYDGDALPTGTNTRRQGVGPCVGSEDDGYGYGANPRLPGLVVLADAGPGVVTSELHNRPAPREARNLAGLFESVAVELRDAAGGTRVVAHMNVPYGLFMPVVVVDMSPGADCGRRVDGVFDCGFAGVEKHLVTVVAFAVNGRAPASLDDRNGDGTVDVLDAVLAGLKPLSEEAHFRFFQLPAHEETLPLFFDFDGDGLAEFPPASPSGPGGLTDPPR